MNELQASISPTTLPCNSQTDQADVEYSDLQLIVANVSGAAIPGLDLQVEFVVDPEGTTGTSTTLVLADYATNVSVTPAPGTAWTPSSPGPCVFQLSPNSGQMEVGEQAVFDFTGIAVDLVQGASPVTITAVNPAGVTVQSTPAVTKAPPELTVVYFTADPQHLIPPANQTTLTWSTIGAGECQLNWDDASAQVSYNNSPLAYNPTNPSQVPLQATGEPGSPPVSAELFNNTEFTLTVTGPGALPPQSCTVQVDQASFSTSAGTVSPYTPFRLMWQCLNDSAPTLSWQPGDAVSSISAASNGEAITPGMTQLEVVDSANVEITSDVIFTLTMIPACQPVPSVPVSVPPVELTEFTGSAEIVDGQQAAALTWGANNATGFTISGNDTVTGTAIPSISVAYNVFSIPPVPLPLVSFPSYPYPLPDPVTFTITASGTSPSPPAPVTRSCTVDPNAVAITSPLSASASEVAYGNPVTLYWGAVYATGFRLSGTTKFGPIASQDIPPGRQLVAIPNLYYTTTFTITAYGYTPDGTFPASEPCTVRVPKPPKEKPEGKEGKEYVKETRALEQPQVQPGAQEADLPSGSQQAFIGSDERPEVGADLPDGGPDDEQP